MELDKISNHLPSKPHANLEKLTNFGGEDTSFQTVKSETLGLKVKGMTFFELLRDIFEPLFVVKKEVEIVPKEKSQIKFFHICLSLISIPSAFAISSFVNPLLFSLESKLFLGFMLEAASSSSDHQRLL